MFLHEEVQREDVNRVKIVAIGIQLSTFDVVGQDVYVHGLVVIQRRYYNGTIPMRGWVMDRRSLLDITFKLRIEADGSINVGPRD